MGAPLDAGAKPSRAQIRAAKKAFKAGQRHYKAKRWAKAIVQFKKAHEITGDGLVMGQVALAFEKAGDFHRALKSIRTYREALPQSDRASVDEMIKRYEGEIAAGKSTHLRLPGEPEPPPKPAPPPEPAAKPQAPIKDAFSAPGEETAEAKPRKRFWTWVLAGSAAALGVSALVVGISAQSKYSELEDGCGVTKTCSDSDVDSVNSRAIATDVLWGTALAAGIAAGVLYFLEGKGESRGAGSVPEPDEEPEGNEEEEEDDLVKRFRIAPILGGGTVGLGAEIRY